MFVFQIIFFLSFELSCNKVIDNKRKIQSQNLRTIDFSTFEIDLRKCNENIISSKNKALTYFIELNSMLDHHAPLRPRLVIPELVHFKAKKRQAKRIY